jgi:hypothetical protein
MDRDSHAAASRSGAPSRREDPERQSAAQEPASDSQHRRSTPDLLAYLDVSISQLRSELAALRSLLEEQASAGSAQKARMVTLNMALNGAPRDEAERYLSENFGLDDYRALLDEVYGTAS